MWRENNLVSVLFEGFNHSEILVETIAVLLFDEWVFFRQLCLHTERDWNVSPDYLGDFREDSSVGELGAKDDTVCSVVTL